MTDSSHAFTLGTEVSHGEFVRQASRFRRSVSTDADAEFPVQAGRYHLYVSLACPWCHRTMIVRELKGLQDALPVSYLAPFRDERGWAFSGEEFDDGPGGRYVDAVNAWSFMSEAYVATEPGYDERVSVPVLWDTVRGEIVNNESADIIRMLDSTDSLGALGNQTPSLYPEPLRPEIDTINERVYDEVNN